MPLFHSFSVLAFPCTSQGVGFNLRSAFFRAIKIGDWVCEFIWLPHTLQPVQCFSGASTPVSDFTLKSANLLSVIEHFQAFSALSCLPPLIFTLKISKTCCPIPTALTYHHQHQAVIPGGRSLLTVSAIRLLLHLWYPMPVDSFLILRPCEGLWE